MRNKFLLLYSWFIRTVLFFLPDVPFVMRFRGFLYGLGMKKCGRDFQVTHDAIIKNLQGISVGNNCFVGNGTVMMGGGTIEIEDQVMLAPQVIVISGNHTSDNGSYRYGLGSCGTIRIEYGAWVAGNSVIQKDSVLPRNSILAANSVLNKDFHLANSIYGGCPAKFIKSKELGCYAENRR